MLRNSKVDKNIQHVKNIVTSKKCNPLKVVTERSGEKKTFEKPQVLRLE
jgi:hypothetical protein